jgi:predicted Rossmann fold nucleotide-binding protein DprA/Smf involved in DNA uptake
MNPSSDSLALLALSSHLGLNAESTQHESLNPLTLKEWNQLEHNLISFGLSPADLLNMGAAEIQSRFSFGDDESRRLTRLLERVDPLMDALERLETLGIQVITRADSDYPQKYKIRLKESAPLTLFFAGNKDLLGQPGIAVVGSRHLDEAGEACAELVGNACGFSGLVLYSGGAKGVDTISMLSALQARGTAVGILADSLERATRKPENRAALQRGDLCLVTPYAPDAGFSVGAAMGRNRLIYTLADYAVVVASDAHKGGTWAGATQAMKQSWVPVFVLDHPNMPEGNRLLLERGALGFPHPFSLKPVDLPNWMHDQASKNASPPEHLHLL